LEEEVATMADKNKGLHPHQIITYSAFTLTLMKKNKESF